MWAERWGERIGCGAPVDDVGGSPDRGERGGDVGAEKLVRERTGRAPRDFGDRPVHHGGTHAVLTEGTHDIRGGGALVVHPDRHEPARMTGAEPSENLGGGCVLQRGGYEPRG